MSQFDSDSESGTISEINLTPLVDVIFTILVVFIVSIPLLTNVITVNLPKTAPTETIQKVSDMRVSIAANGEMFLNQEKIAPNGLEAELRKHNVGGQLRVEILADEAVAYREVARAMVQIRRAGVEKFTFVVLPEHDQTNTP
ncbi:MAG: biopolymer transporter ExbD [Betaproteobacteria bacterium HGW-Betaproteobacteria-1]|jgi:biopolymer transport protein ExbD|nr:MAG: biopolymer transporter ExbD [Betaproteobacteria bacterium HGW-Betaproteobacteria-1]